MPADLLFSYWSARDLEIIPNIIIPIERAMRQTNGDSPAPFTKWEEMLLDLYRAGAGERKPEEPKARAETHSPAAGADVPMTTSVE